MSLKHVSIFAMLTCMVACSSPSETAGGDNAGGTPGSSGSSNSGGNPGSGGSGGSGTPGTGGMSSGGGNPGGGSGGASQLGTPATPDFLDQMRPSCEDYCVDSLTKDGSTPEPMCPDMEMTQPQCVSDCLAGSMECILSNDRLHQCQRSGNPDPTCVPDDQGVMQFEWNSSQCMDFNQLRAWACEQQPLTAVMLTPQEVEGLAVSCETYCTVGFELGCNEDSDEDICINTCIRGDADCLRKKQAQYTCEMEATEPQCVRFDDGDHASWNTASCAVQRQASTEACPADALPF